MLAKIAIQILGQLLVAAFAFYWLGLGVGSSLEVALNLLGGLLILFALAALDAYGLGNWRHALWALPAVLSLALLYWKTSAVIVLVLLWLIVLLPTAARARWSYHLHPRYLGMGTAILALSALPALALVFWVPNVEGLRIEIASAVLRYGLAAVFLYGGWALLLDFVRRETMTPKPENPFPAVTPHEPQHP